MNSGLSVRGIGLTTDKEIMGNTSRGWSKEEVCMRGRMNRKPRRSLRWVTRHLYP